MPRFPALSLLAAAVVALLHPPIAAAEIYKWVDEKGVVNYGSIPPPGRSAKELPKDAAGITVVPAQPLPPPSPIVRTPADARVEQLEKALAEERAARQAQEQSEEERRQAAIAKCEASRGVDCEANPYQYDGGYGYGYVPVRRHLWRPQAMQPLPKPPPARPPKPRPLIVEREAPAASQPRLPVR